MIIKNEALGIDIGNVIINHRLTDKNDETLHEERYSTIPASENVFEAIKKLNDSKFHGNIFLISKCTPWAQEKILTWLKDNNFYSRTGVKPEKVLFCRERHEKDKICKDNNITYLSTTVLKCLVIWLRLCHTYFYFSPTKKKSMSIDNFYLRSPELRTGQKY